MKYRADFVTNSSSSSFIVSKKNSIKTTEDLFQYIKKCYSEWFQYRKELIKYCENNPDFKIQYQKDKPQNIIVKTIYGFKTDKDQDKNEKINTYLKRNFKMSLWESLNYDIEWTKANSYKEYLELTKQEHFLSKNKKPFIIYDFFDPDKELSKDIISIVQWYFPCYLNDFEKPDCDFCNHINTDICHQLKFNKFVIPITEFGHVCLFSESGFIPDYVVKQLHKESEYSCNHMG